MQNSEVVSIQAFIGSLPGYEDIPSLFHEILNGGLYIPESLHLGPRPALPGQKQPPVSADHRNHLFSQANPALERWT